MFIKTFFDVVVDEFQNVEVIVLRRELPRVLKSCIQLGYFSPINSIWPKWLPSPNARTAALPCIGRDADLDQFDLCIAYLFDIEARVQRFKRDYPRVKIHEVRLEGLNEYSKAEKFFADLRITPTAKTRESCGRKVNERTERKEKFSNPAKLEYCRERIALYIKKAESLGITLPVNTAALEPYKD